MINGFGLQWADMDSMSARQVMLIPASQTAYGRTISTTSPRKPWTPISYQPLTNAFGDAVIQKALADTLWRDREIQKKFLTSEPFGFTMTDDEWTELMSTSQMPRNVPLRFIRSCEEKGGTVLGAGARAMGEVRENVAGALDLVAGEYVSDRLTNRLQQLITAVEEKDTSLLDAITPDSARARGDNVQRNQHNLPVAVPTPQAPAPETPSAPTLPIAALVGTSVAPGTRLTRPNGHPYYARKIIADAGELSDVDMLRRAWKRQMNVLLYGVPGTGKTALCEVAAEEGLITMLGTGEVIADDFLGTWVQTGPDQFEWVDGYLVRAMEEDKKLLIDEVGVIDPRAMTQVYGVMDGRRTLTIPGNPMRGEIVAGPNFGIVCATNPNAPGVRLSEALLSRMGLMVEVSTSYAVARKMDVNDRLVQAAEHFAKLVDTGEISWSPQMRELLDFQSNEAEFGLVFALRALLNQAPEDCREVIHTNLKERFGNISGISRKLKPLSIDD